jgi:hypothetical protein
MQFKDDAFISYAHLDNVELVAGHKGWVAELHNYLEKRLPNFRGEAVDIWRDPKLTGNDVFEQSIMERLRLAAILLAVVTPRYLKSEWTIRELNAFWSAAEAQGGVRVRDKARVFKILKTRVPLEQQPEALRGLLGYEFFKVDPETGKERELGDIFALEAGRESRLRADDLAHDICDLLIEIEGPGGSATTAPTRDQTAKSPQPATTAAAQSGTVYLAETTSDLRDYRDVLKRDLLESGYRVMPDRPLPWVAAEAETAIREAVAECRLAIHPIGRVYSLVPEGGDRSLVELQHQIAGQRDGAASFSRIIWIPEGLKVDDDRQRRVLDALRSDRGLGGGSDLVETSIEGVRTLVQAWIKKDRAPVPDAAKPAPVTRKQPVPWLYLVADERDVATLDPWADALFATGVEVIKPIFKGDEAEIRAYHEDNLATCDGVLIFFGSGSNAWVGSKLCDIRKSLGLARKKPQPLTAICLIGARTTEKEQFRSNDVAVIPQWNGVDLQGLDSFLLTLKAGGVV